MEVYDRYTSITYAKDLKVLKRFVKDKQSPRIIRDYNKPFVYSFSIPYKKYWYYQESKKVYTKVVSRRLISRYKRTYPISRHISHIILTDTERSEKCNYILIVDKNVLLKSEDSTCPYMYTIIKPKQFTKFYY